MLLSRSTRKWVGVLAAVGITAATLVSVSGGSAQAKAKPMDCRGAAVSPSTLSLGLSDVSVRFNVTAYCTDNYLSDWSFDSSLFGFTVDESSPGVSFYPQYLHDSAAGPYTFNVTTYDEDGYPDYFNLPFHLKRYSTWGNTFNAGPEPIKKGANISFTGELLRVNWDQGQYYGYPNGYTQLQFRTRNTATYHTIKTFRTSTASPGNIINLTSKAVTSGTWRVYYTGNDFGSPAYSKEDYVEVD